MTDLIATTLAEVKDTIDGAIARSHRLEVCSTGTKRHLGRTPEVDAVLNVSGLSGIIDYQPEELVLSLIHI